jgi:catechol 2,3-dioxygenase-like lactoylglutathione lyase family enzyme
MMAMEISSFQQQVTFLYTRDLEKCAVFYQGVLGLQLVLDQGTCRIYQVCPNGFIGLCQNPDAPQHPQGVVFTMISDDIDGWYTRLREQHIPVEKPPAINPKYNIYHLFVRDPNGYLIEIQRFLDPAWPNPIPG